MGKREKSPGRPRLDKDRIRTTLWLDRQTQQLWEDLASRWGCSRSEAARRAIYESVHERATAPAPDLTVTAGGQTYAVACKFDLLPAKAMTAWARQGWVPCKARLAGEALDGQAPVERLQALVGRTLIVAGADGGLELRELNLRKTGAGFEVVLHPHHGRGRDGEVVLGKNGIRIIAVIEYFGDRGDQVSGYRPKKD